ncbi:MAG: helix-turn-helix domain-containing protein [Lachnospiraceae bacterium]|nr:helix-turn-helix domain-containing protein [Lachnospiraceae bacterium]
MIVVNNIGGMDPLEISEKHSAERVGQRIREIRMSQGISQVELGKRVGLTGERIQKYEKGTRKPKLELLKQIAKALGVETQALADPIVCTYEGAMYSLFEMEKRYDLKVRRVDGRLILMFGDGSTGPINSQIDEWEKECRFIEEEINEAGNEEERNAIRHDYDMWKWTFPNALVDRSEEVLKEARMKKLQEQIAELQKQLDGLKDEE